MLWEGTKCEFEISSDPLLAYREVACGGAEDWPAHPSVRLVVGLLLAALARHDL